MSTPCSNFDDIMDVQSHKLQKKPRNLIGFWFLGLCNNYAYVIMLSAAHDLLHDDFHETTAIYNTTSSNNGTERYCNSVSTGAILLADILPSLAMKLIAPFLDIGINVRVFVVVLLSALSFIITSTSIAHWMTFIGVISAALSSGLGEVTFLSFSSYFDKDVVSTWSSGTGGAGVIGALSYASLTHILSINTTLQVMLVIPVILAATFWVLIEHPPHTKLSWNCNSETNLLMQQNVLERKENRNIFRRYTFNEKINLIKPLLKYMIPLAIVYFAEYFINQGLLELVFFPGLWLVHKEQYRWYQVDYQFGVLISRSSVNLFKIRKLWILPVLQVINFVFLFLEAYYLFLPSIWIVLGIIFYEGLLGGWAYVNTFYAISEEVPKEHTEFSMGIASLGDSIGIAMAGALALPVHDALCKMHS